MLFMKLYFHEVIKKKLEALRGNLHVVARSSPGLITSTYKRLIALSERL